MTRCIPCSYDHLRSLQLPSSSNSSLPRTAKTPASNNRKNNSLQLQQKHQPAPAAKHQPPTTAKAPASKNSKNTSLQQQQNTGLEKQQKDLPPTATNTSNQKQQNRQPPTTAKAHCSWLYNRVRLSIGRPYTGNQLLTALLELFQLVFCFVLVRSHFQHQLRQGRVHFLQVHSQPAPQSLLPTSPCFLSTAMHVPAQTVRLACMPSLFSTHGDGHAWTESASSARRPCLLHMGTDVPRKKCVQCAYQNCRRPAPPPSTHTLHAHTHAHTPRNHFSSPKANSCF